MTVPVLLNFSALLGSSLMLYNINQHTIRQAITPDRLLGRVNSGIFVLVSLAAVIGSLLGGTIGQAVGLRAALRGDQTADRRGLPDRGQTKFR